MFHDGDLQSGIALAIQQGKSVVCFVRDESAESATWEDEWMKDDQVKPALEAKAVALRIQGGSQEAGFLSAFCPVESVPAVIVIQNGQLRENITSDADYTAFVSRIRTALGAEGMLVDSSPTNLASEAAPPQASEPPSEPIPPTNIPSNPASAPDEPPDPRREAIEARRRELAAERQRIEANASASPPPQPPQPPQPAKATNKDKGKGKAPAEPAQSTSTTADRGRSDWLAQQRARNQAARVERERILAQIEADKVERAARREEERRALKGEGLATPIDTNSGPAKPVRNKGKSSGECLITARLPSGSMARQSFPASAKPTTEVRPWLDDLLKEEQNSRRAPAYTLKLHLPPAPAQTLAAAEEAKTLGDLGMPPAASVVVSLVQGGVSAYSVVPVASGSIMGWFASLFTGLWAAILGVLSSVFGGFGGGARSSSGPDSSAPPKPATTSDEKREDGMTTGISIRTFADQKRDAEKDGKEGETWYNGNQTSFQPKGDGKDE